jgi:hypothetical protein
MKWLNLAQNLRNILYKKAKKGTSMSSPKLIIDLKWVRVLIRDSSDAIFRKNSEYKVSP